MLRLNEGLDGVNWQLTNGQPTALKDLCQIKLKSHLNFSWSECAACTTTYLQLKTIISKTLNCAHYSQQLWRIYTQFPILSMRPSPYCSIPKTLENYQGVVKESKESTKWASKHFTHEKSYYRVPHTGTEFTNVKLSEEINPRLKVLWKNCGKVSFVEAKDSSGGNYQGQSRGFTTGCLHMDLLARLGNDFNSGDQPEGRLKKIGSESNNYLAKLIINSHRFV